MSDATLGQAAHILRIVEEKGTPKSQLQDIIRMGLLADLLDANVGEVNREEYRRILGLLPLVAEGPRDPNSFFRTRKGLYVWDEFRSLVVAKGKYGAEPVATKHILLKHPMSDAEIEEMLGEGHIFDEASLCATLAQMLSKQEGGKKGKLLNHNYANLFYTSSCVVDVSWINFHRHWHVAARDRDEDYWNARSRVFSPATEA